MNDFARKIMAMANGEDEPEETKVQETPALIQHPKDDAEVEVR